MKKIFTFLCMALFVAVAVAQQPQGIIMKASEAPVVDGVLDAVWAEAEVYDIDKPYRTEVPTIGQAGETNWRALWTEQGIYVFVTVNDDQWYPSYASGGNAWEYDKPEVYFDVNYVLNDGQGAMHGAGHYQVSPTPVEARIDGTPNTDTNNGIVHAFKVSGGAYTVEYFVPFSYLKNSDGIEVDKTGVMGFDVTIIDRDPGDEGRRRAVWANVGNVDESWSNMDDVGLLTFDGAEPPVFIEQITLTGGYIIEDNGTLQIGVEILPEDASNKALRWTVENTTGRATVNSTGLVKAILNGAVTITAEATDGSYELATVDVNISGQIPTEWELNVIRNGAFDEVTETGGPAGWGGWIDGGYGEPHAVVDGVATLVVTQANEAENWHYQFNQENLTALPDIPYIVKYKAWADKDRNITFDFEDTSANGYNRYGASPDPESNGRSEWTHAVSTEPTMFTWNVTFDQIVPTTVQKAQFMISQTASTVFIDSVLLIAVQDLDLVPEGNALVLNVKMAHWASLGKFNPETDFVDVAGSFNGWDGVNHKLTAVGDPDHTYTIMIENMEEGNIEFKFRINGSWSDETSEFPAGGPNRNKTIVEGPNSYTAWYNDEEGTTNVNEPTLSATTLNVYPNPARETLNIVSSELIREIRLINAIGQIVHSQSVDYDRAQIPVGGFDRGLYLIQVLTAKGVSVERVLISR